MPFFPTVFYSPATAADQFNNIFQMMNELDQSQFGEEQAQKARQQKTPIGKAAQPNAIQGQPRAGKSRVEAPRTALNRTQPSQQQLQRRRPGTDLAHDLADIFGVNLGSLAPSSRPFNPRFDVRETEEAYELHGELAGADRENIHLEFTEPQQLVISGHVERKYSRSSEEEEKADTFSEIATPRSPSPARSHRAMVVDEDTEEALERGEVVETKAAEPAGSKAADKDKAQTEKTPNVRYWLQERSVGEFHRVFNFPAPVDEASVRANLDNGILSVTIPKAKRQARRIAVF